VMTLMPPPIDPKEQARFTTTIKTLATFDFNLLVLKPGEMAIDKKQRVIDLWWRGENNGSLMALLAHLVRQDKNWSNASLRVLRIVRSAEEEKMAEIHLRNLIEQIRISAEVHVIHSNEPPPEVIRKTSAPKADLVFLGMSAADGEAAERFLTQMTPLLINLPTTLLVWSNGEADIFA
jgi:hypothetical protein